MSYLDAKYVNYSIKNIDKNNKYMDDITLKDGFLGQKMIVLPNEVKKKLATNVITSPFYITDIGYYPNANHHYVSRENGANEYIFIYCTEGKGWLEMGSHKMEVLPNQFFIIPERTDHKYSSNDEAPWSIYWMHFKGAIAMNLFDRYNSNHQLVRNTRFYYEQMDLFNQIFGIFNSDYIDYQMEYANILSLNFISSFVYQDIVQLANTSKNGNLIDTIIDFLLNNIDKSFKSEDIAQEFNYSSSYIFNLFKKKTGYSLIHFFNLKKMQKACEYLYFTNLTIKEISFKVGFQDPLYFSRLFKKLMGVSPRNYKKRQGG